MTPRTSRAGPKTIYYVGEHLLERTRQTLLETGRGRVEAVALWAGAVHEEDRACVTQVITPHQVAGPLHFNVALEVRIQLATELAAAGQVILAQIHTHPREAFHSPVDDRLAIPQHKGALSLVVPYFATKWDGSLLNTSVNQHLGGGRWRELTEDEVTNRIRIQECPTVD